MLDNAYFYLAATRLSLHRPTSGWVLVIETFGYSPREGSSLGGAPAGAR